MSKGGKDNLRPPWKPGESGNPGGRPKKRPVTDEYFALADLAIPESMRMRIPKKRRPPKGTTFSQSTALTLWFQSWMENAHRAAKELREALEGKAPQRLEISGPERKEITLKVEFVNKKRQSSRE